MPAVAVTSVNRTAEEDETERAGRAVAPPAAGLDRCAQPLTSKQTRTGGTQRTRKSPEEHRDQTEQGSGRPLACPLVSLKVRVSFGPPDPSPLAPRSVAAPSRPSPPAAPRSGTAVPL